MSQELLSSLHIENQLTILIHKKYIKEFGRSYFHWITETKHKLCNQFLELIF